MIKHINGGHILTELHVLVNITREKGRKTGRIERTNNDE